MLRTAHLRADFAAPYFKLKTTSFKIQRILLENLCYHLSWCFGCLWLIWTRRSFLWINSCWKIINFIKTSNIWFHRNVNKVPLMEDCFVLQFLILYLTLRNNKKPLKHHFRKTLKAKSSFSHYLKNKSFNNLIVIFIYLKPLNYTNAKNIAFIWLLCKNNRYD